MCSSDLETVTLEITAKDAAGHATIETCHFHVLERDVPVPDWQPIGLRTEAKLTINPSYAGKGQLDGATLSWPAQTCFELTDISFQKVGEGWSGSISPTDVPFRQDIALIWPIPMAAAQWEGGFQVTPSEPFLQDRWVAALQDRDGWGEVVVAEVKEKTWHFAVGKGGTWSMLRDTLPPVVMPYHSGSPLVKESGDAVWFVDDALSGIDELTLTIDGEWARLVWDPKRNMATYECSDARHDLQSRSLLKLEVTDQVGNVGVWEGSIAWP